MRASVMDTLHVSRRVGARHVLSLNPVAARLCTCRGRVGRVFWNLRVRKRELEYVEGEHPENPSNPSIALRAPAWACRIGACDLARGAVFRVSGRQHVQSRIERVHRRPSLGIGGGVGRGFGSRMERRR